MQTSANKPDAAGQPAEQELLTVTHNHLRTALAVAAAQTGGPEAALAAAWQHLSEAAAQWAPGMRADTILLKHYGADGTERMCELHSALNPWLQQRLAHGQAFQLVFWGHGPSPSAVPQAGAPVQPLGANATSAGTPEPECSLTSTPSTRTALPATGQV